MGLVVPDQTKSIQQGAIEPWSKPHYRAQLVSLKRAARKHKVRLDVPWAELSDEEKQFVVEGGADPSTGSGSSRATSRDERAARWGTGRGPTERSKK